MSVKSNYVAKVWIVYTITLADLVLNGIADHGLTGPSARGASSGPSWMPLVWIGAQLAIQALNAAVLAVMLFDTVLFQVGLVSLLLKEFRGLFVGLGMYAVGFGVYAAVKAALVMGEGGISEADMWGDSGFAAVSILQKLGALAYYALLLHYCAKLGQPHWYQKHHWVAKFSAQARGQFYAGFAGGGGAGGGGGGVGGGGA